MPYLNLDLGFLRHPKTKRLVGLLGRGAEVLLIRLWIHCGEFHCEDGRLTACPPQEIETIVEWWGAPGKCVEAFLKAGFLVPIDDGFAIHDWLDHSGHLSAFKKRGRTNARIRWDNPGGNATGNATSIPPVIQTDASGNAPALLTKPTNQPPGKNGCGLESPKGDPDAPWLYRAWLFYLRRTPFASDCDGPFDELVRLGYSPPALRKAIEDSRRDRAESIFDFVKRFKAGNSPQTVEIDRQAYAAQNQDIDAFIGK